MTRIARLLRRFRAHLPHAARVALAAALPFAVLALARAALAIELPPDFVSEDVAPGAGFLVPTAIAFIPDGRMLVAEKRGRVHVVKNGVKLPTPMWSRENEVLDEADRGLLGLAVDPDYATNHFVYFMYTVDPDSNGVDDANSDGFGRLVRYRTSAADSNVVDASTRTILFGTTWTDAPIIGSPSHSIGCLRFGRDGSLLATMGDGAQFNDMDPGGADPEMFQPGRANPYEDIGAFRSQNLWSMGGKLMRLDPATGHGYPSNPFWDGNPKSVRSRVWAYGLRNPFRFTVRPGTGSTNPADGSPGTIYLGDVGWSEWEEANVVKTPGANFGWPCYEGIGANLAYQAANPSHGGCDSIGIHYWNPNPVTPPLATWNHGNPDIGVPPGFRGNTSIGGAFYTGTSYPAIYRNRYFFADYGANFIKVMVVDSTDALQSVIPFVIDAEGPVDLQTNPANGDLYYVSIFTFEVRRIRYVGGGGGGNHAPVAVATGIPSAGAPPLDVAFSSVGTYDLDGDSLVTQWTFGDGEGSTLPNPAHTYAANGTYDAILLVDDGQGGIGRDTVRITVAPNVGFPSTPVLDDFNRANGPIGGLWVDQTAGLAVDANELIQPDGTGYATTVWSGAVYDTSQEAYFTLKAVTPAALEHDVLLKLQGTSSSDAHIEVRWDGTEGAVRVATYTPGVGWEARGGPYPIQLQPGDQYGARARGNGLVEVYVNGVPIGVADCSTWPYAAATGRIGMAFDLAYASRMDDFGGGSTIVNTPPVAGIASPADSGFYAAGDTLRFIGTKSDAEDPPSALTGHWSLHLIHNNHFHIEGEVDGDTAMTVALDHDDGTGVHYLGRYFVTDGFGAKDTAIVHLFPENDLDPTPVTIVPAAPNSAQPLLYEFRLVNHGRLPVRRTRWSLVADGAAIAEGDTVVAALDTVRIVRVLPPLAAGEHVIRVVADSLGEAVETNESNNAETRALTVNGPPVAVGEAPLALALSPPWPNPSSGRVRFELALPAGARVEFAVHDVLGRRVWSAPTRALPAGRTSLAWDGAGDDGRPARPGLYLARVAVDGRVLLRRFAILR